MRPTCCSSVAAADQAAVVATEESVDEDLLRLVVDDGERREAVDRPHYCSSFEEEARFAQSADAAHAVADAAEIDVVEDADVAADAGDQIDGAAIAVAADDDGDELLPLRQQ